MPKKHVQLRPGGRIALVMATIRQRIASRSLGIGDRLPSIRGLARSLQVSVSTVAEAYNRLVAEGVIVARPGSGFFVANQLAPMSLSAVGPKLDRAIDPLWVSRQSLETDDGSLKPGCGWLPASWLPLQAIRQSLRELAREEPEALSDYGTPLGLAPLRQIISRRLGERGVLAAPDQIMLVESGTQALDLLCRYLLRPGDCVLIDDPGYFNFQALLRAHQVRMVGVPYGQHGPDLEALAAVLDRHRPRLYVTNSAVHNGSFSKTLSAAARCGFIAARPDWIEGLIELKIATSFGASRLNEGLVCRVLGHSGFRRHGEGVRRRLEHARRDAAQRLGSMGVTSLIEPQAGMFLWCQLPQGRDAAVIARAALQHGVVLAPGNAFSLSQSHASSMRFNVAQMDDDIFGLIEQLLG